jgi:hypothetical protein
MKQVQTMERIRTQGDSATPSEGGGNMSTSLLQEQNALMRQMVEGQNRQQSMMANINLSSSIMFDQRVIYELRKEIKKQESIESNYKS